MTRDTERSPVRAKEPTPPFPEQHLTPPGLESELDPEPRYLGEDYRAAGKLEDKVSHTGEVLTLLGGGTRAG